MGEREITRRGALGLAGKGAVAAWAVPTIMSVPSVAAAQGSAQPVLPADFVGVTTNAIWRGVSDGTAWASITAFPAAPSPPFLGHVVRAAATTWVTVGQNGDVFWRSVDDGLNWTAATTPPTGFFFTDALAQGDGRVVVLGKISAAGNNQRIWESTDGGDTWSQKSVAPVSFNDIVWTGSRWVGVGSQVYWATSLDGPWTPATSIPAGVSSLYGVGAAGSTLLAVGTEGIILRSTDGAQTWTTAKAAIGGSGYAYTAVHNGTNWVVTGGNGSNWYSADDGLTWNPIPTLSIGISYGGLAVSPAGTFVAMGTGGGNPWRSTNDGLSFNALGGLGGMTDVAS